MKIYIFIISAFFIICGGFLFFYLFGYPSLPISTPPKIQSLVRGNLKYSYKVFSIKSVTRTSTFEEENRQMKWLIINLDHQSINDNKEKWAISEKVCKVVLKFGYEGVDILPSTIKPIGVNCGDWGA